MKAFAAATLMAGILTIGAFFGTAASGVQSPTQPGIHRTAISYPAAQHTGYIYPSGR